MRRRLHSKRKVKEYMHSRVRDRNLVNNLSDVYIGRDDRKIVDIEKHIEQAVLGRTVEAEGNCLPNYVKKE